VRRRRHLSAEERELWEKVAERTRPLNPIKHKKNAFLESNDAPKSATKPVPPAAPNLAPFKLGEKVKHSHRHDLAPSIIDHLNSAAVQMDARSYGKMKRGKLAPESRIDLHGMTIDEAHPALLSFILSAHANGDRLVLVITGKGKDRDDGGPIPTRFGVLRHQVPQWFRMVPLRQVILQVTPAHIRHGGHGAYYVYLRRGR